MFSESYDQHLKNVGRLRALEQQQQKTAIDTVPPEAVPDPAQPASASKPAANGSRAR